MILRRVTQHVKEQNWTAIALDFLIVVVGVFIGIQVANWNEEQSDAVREKEVLADLLEDLRADRTSLSASKALTTLGIDAGNMLLMAAGFEPVKSISIPVGTNAFNTNLIEVELPSPPNEAIRGQLWKHSILRLYPSHNDAMIESLIVADNSSVIKNPSLVRDLLRYRTLWNGLEDAQVTTFRPIRDRIMFVGQEHGFSPLTSIDLDVLVDALQADPALRGALRTMLEYTIAHQSFFNTIKQASETLAERVDAELQK